MKKARTIKIIKSRSVQPVQAIPLPEEGSKAKQEERCPVRVVKNWVSEYHEQKLLAEQVALKLLYSSTGPGKFNDKYSNS
jgi:hypothetical protein